MYSFIDFLLLFSPTDFTSHTTQTCNCFTKELAICIENGGDRIQICYNNTDFKQKFMDACMHSNSINTNTRTQRCECLLLIFKEKNMRSKSHINIFFWFSFSLSV